MDPAAKHYIGEAGSRYHEQRAAARDTFNQRSRALYFAGFTNMGDEVLDFGCGTGGLLAELPAQRRVGVEVNPLAAIIARQVLDEVVSHMADLPAQRFEKVISFHALEHVAEPIATLHELRRLLKPTGALRLMVPYESAILDREQRTWKPNDPMMHLYSWTPRTLGNLLSVAGFHPHDVRIVPWSEGGRLAQLLRFAPPLRGAATWLKALRSRRLQILASAMPVR
jgi:SAM-dependent methyltransferase